MGRFQRVPTLFELFGDRGTTIGNPRLKPETSLNWDIGFSFELPPHGWLDRLFLECAYFVSDADDLIVFVQNSQVSARAENIGAAEIRGHELSWSATVLHHVRFYGNYAYQDAKDTSDTFSQGNALPGRPRHEVFQALELFHIGLLICADAYTRDIAARLKSQGADILVSPAAWGPGLHGPEGEWEQRTVETGLPLIVCNRTGNDHTVSFMGAESLVVKNGKRLLAHHSERSVVLTFDWDLATMELVSKEYHKDYL